MRLKKSLDLLIHFAHQDFVPASEADKFKKNLLVKLSYF